MSEPAPIRLTTLGTLALDVPAGSDPARVLAQHKRLGLLVFLAAEVRRRPFRRRDALLALFWPELPTDRARQALRQSLYYLRQELGDDVFVSRGTEDIGVDPGRLACDVGEFEALLDEGRPHQAMDLYRGDFLPGFFIADASPEFEDWLETTRAHLKRRATRAAWLLATAAEGEGNLVGATQWLRWVVERVPDDEVVVRRLIATLDRLGDHAGAVRAYDALERLLARDHETQPSEETRALVRQLGAGRDEIVLPQNGDGSHRERPEPASAPPTVSGPTPPVRRLAVGGAVLVGLAAMVAIVGAPASRAPVLAVGAVEDRTGDVTRPDALPDLFTTALARVPQLQVVSRGRLYDVLAQLGETDMSPGTLRRAAVTAGATQILEGELYAVRDGRLRLDLRRVDAATGRVVQATSLWGDGALEALDRATAEVATALGRSPPAWRLSEAGGVSLVARRLYDEGLRAYYQNDGASAGRLFGAAVREDSTFAMAAFYLALTELRRTGGSATARALLGRAADLADRGSDQERLVIRSRWAITNSDPAALAYAETLAVRYPALPESHYLLGNAMVVAGDLLDALPHLRRAVAADSLAFSGRSPRCTACEAIHRIVDAYLAADSAEAAVRVAREWIRLAPETPFPHAALAEALERLDRFDEAMAARRRAQPWLDADSIEGLYQARLDIRGGAFAAADRRLRQLAAGATPGARHEALWWLVISLRHQGRFQEALTAARQFRVLGDSVTTDATFPPLLHAIPEAVVLTELGRGREAAALFDSIADTPRDRHPSAFSRHRTWTGTHRATALASVGDTAGLAALADSMEQWGQKSLLDRDRRLHHYVRGLLWQARGEHRAAAREFQAGIVTPALHGRGAYALARELVTLGRPREAIAVLHAVLRGSLEGENLYVSRTEVIALLARAYDAAGRADSAAVYYRRVADAWRQADALVTGPARRDQPDDGRVARTRQ